MNDMTPVLCYGLVCILNLISLPNRWLSFLYMYSIFLCTIGQRV